MKGTIKSGDEISLLFNKGKRITTTSVTALVLVGKPLVTRPHEGERGRIAVIAGKRLGNAVQRSKAKRRIREAARFAQAPWQGYDVALIAREAILSADFSMIAKDMEKIAAKIQGLTDDRSRL